MKRSIIEILFLLFCFATALSSCKKNWLDAKPLQSLVVPNTLKDYQALLDNSTGDNGGAATNAKQNTLGEISAGDFYITDQNWQTLTPLERNSYTWDADIYGGETNYSEWQGPYERIFYMNIILEGIDELVPHSVAEQHSWNQIKGSAYFLRAYSHYDISQLFCKPYDPSSASGEMGIPLRLSSDFTQTSVRATVQQTYDQIISDLKDAAQLLPVAVPDVELYKLRPTKAAAFAMLSRVYLSMDAFDSAYVYADNCLQLYSTLMDYNDISISSSANVAFPRFNEEVIFHMEGNSWSALRRTVLIIDSTLFQLYDSDDLRRNLFFRNNGGTLRYRGSYTGSAILFCGLATDEIWLIRAESLARKGMLTEAMQDIQTLLVKRWLNTASPPDLTPVDQQDAINTVLGQRRRELCFRGLRWSDLRRLNKESSLSLDLTRIVDGQTYILPANHPKYILPIPPEVIALTGMAQNVR